jgi:hypothetical protein
VLLFGFFALQVPTRGGESNVSHVRRDWFWGLDTCSCSSVLSRDSRSIAGPGRLISAAAAVLRPRGRDPARPTVVDVWAGVFGVDGQKVLGREALMSRRASGMRLGGGVTDCQAASVCCSLCRR